MENSPDEKTIIKIRNRASYKLFQELYVFLKSKQSIENILRKFYDELDDRRCFGSRQNAEYAKESLSQVCKDNRIEIRQEDKMQASGRQ